VLRAETNGPGGGGGRGGRNSVAIVHRSRPRSEHEGRTKFCPPPSLSLSLSLSVFLFACLSVCLPLLPMSRTLYARCRVSCQRSRVYDTVPFSLFSLVPPAILFSRRSFNIAGPLSLLFSFLPSRFLISPLPLSRFYIFEPFRESLPIYSYPLLDCSSCSSSWIV